MSPLNRVNQQAKSAARQASPAIEKLARVGLAARGLVYVVIGVLAVEAAVGDGGKTTSTRGAMGEIHRFPGGDVLLVIMALGLFGFAAFRFVQAWMDPERRDHGAKETGRRIGYAGSGVIHAGLAITALQLAMGSSKASRGDSSQAQHWTARVFEQPLGEWIVGLVGVGIIAFGVFQIVRGYRASFRRELELGRMSGREEVWATRSGRIGMIARGVVFDVVGVFLILAAMRSDPHQARGLDGALAALAGTDFGPMVLALVAIGLVAFGVYCFVEARYRRIVAR